MLADSIDLLSTQIEEEGEIVSLQALEEKNKLLHLAELLPILE